MKTQKSREYCTFILNLIKEVENCGMKQDWAYSEYIY
jgi:hypothetical protein